MCEQRVIRPIHAVEYVENINFINYLSLQTVSVNTYLSVDNFFTIETKTACESLQENQSYVQENKKFRLLLSSVIFLVNLVIS